MNLIDWAQPPSALAATEESVHVWRAYLRHDAGTVAKLARTLSVEERERARRFRFERHRDRFQMARAFLRIILGRYLDQDPATIRFVYNPHGKPGLVGGEIQFNLSHSGDIVLYAFTRRRAVGIDVETIHQPAEVTALSPHFFSEAENRELAALPPDQRQRAFTNCWTRKEAYLKARGEGLAVDLSTFDVTLRPGQPARLLHVKGQQEEAKRWVLLGFQPDADHIAALAVEGKQWRPFWWRYEQR